MLPQASHRAPGAVTHSKQAATDFATHFVMVSGLISLDPPRPHHSKERELCRYSAALIQVPCFWCSDAPDPALLGHRTPRDPALGVPDPSQWDVSMGSHRTVQGLQLTLSCRDRNQEKAMVHPRAAQSQSQPQQQRQTPRRCWGAIFPPQCWVIQEVS